MSAGRESTFVTTRWTQVLASRGNSEQARQALSELCAVYYAPVVTFLRSEGRNEESARELAHEFFARVLERQSLGGADPQRGRFRSYLLGALKHFLVNRRVQESREKRGSQFVHESLDANTEISADSSATNSSMARADASFDREWALGLLERTLLVMRAEATDNGAGREFELLKPWLTGETPPCSQIDVARDLEMTESAVRVSVHRLRRRFRELIKAEISQTVDDPKDVSEEMRHLVAALS